jgi:hypothetical protein
MELTPCHQWVSEKFATEPFIESTPIPIDRDIDCLASLISQIFQRTQRF